MNRKIMFSGIIALALLVVFLTFSRTTFSQEGVTPGLPAVLLESAEALIWKPNIEYASAVLELFGPDEAYHVLTFAPGQKIEFLLDGAEGTALADGLYTYRLQFYPVLSPRAVATLTAAGDPEIRDQAIMDGLIAEGEIPATNLLQEGQFSIAGGKIVKPQSEAQSSTGEFETNGPEAPADQVIADDLIVQGSICSGFDCIADENFGADTLRLKENNLRIHFEDTSAAGFPGDDWRIIANDSASGGANYFAVENSSFGRVPFKIDGSAPTGALYVANTGNIGLGTSSPAVELHIADGDSPTLRLEQDGSSGFTAQTWDVVGNEANFFIRDVTNSSRLVFRIQPGAASNSIAINNNGRVLIGPGLGTGGFPAINATLNIQAADSTFRVDNTTTAVTTLDLDSSGNMTVAGNMVLGGLLTEGSDRNSKENIAPIDKEAILERLAAIPITTWNYIADDDAVRHMGPMAQDFYSAFGLGADDRHVAALDVNGVALAGVQELYSQMQMKEARIAELEQKNADLEQRLADLEAAVAALIAAQGK